MCLFIVLAVNCLWLVDKQLSDAIEDRVISHFSPQCVIASLMSFSYLISISSSKSAFCFSVTVFIRPALGLDDACCSGLPWISDFRLNLFSADSKRRFRKTPYQENCISSTEFNYQLRKLVIKTCVIQIYMKKNWRILNMEWGKSSHDLSWQMSRIFWWWCSISRE